MNTSLQRLTYCELECAIDVQFWERLRQQLVAKWKLDEPLVPIRGFLTLSLGALQLSTASNGVFFRFDSFPDEHTGSQILRTSDSICTVEIPGFLRNYNTMEKLNSDNLKEMLLSALYEQILEPLFIDGEIGSVPNDKVWANLSFTFALIRTFADAKAYKFYHREAFPAMFLKSPFLVESMVLGITGELPFSRAHAEQIHEQGKTRVKRAPLGALSPFLSTIERDNEDGPILFLDFNPTAYQQAFNRGAKVILCVADCSGVPESVSWPVRNLITCLRLAFPWLESLSIYALRPGMGENSLFVECTCATLEPGPIDQCFARLREARSTDTPINLLEELTFLNVTGWRKKKISMVDLSTVMNPSLRAEQDSRLNLELMKWRMLEDLDLEKLRQCRALLLGTGTLGCNVARNLLMWGVRDITLVDRGHVSYSNLARQSLFTVDDAKHAAEKTVAAAAALKAIIPNVQVHAVTLSIPMPGHRMENTRGTDLNDMERLIKLVKDHDVVFLLTDSREARWVPTVVAAAHGIPVINVALGFDTYVVMRHGLVATTSTSNASGTEASHCNGSQIGCYFCSDVVAPTDTMHARTLDQQCTVTRPGVSSVASAIAVELLASLYQHELGFRCPCVQEAQHARHSCDRSRLGVLPQQIRGSVFLHNMTHLYCERNSHCTACAPIIIEQYLELGADFLVACVNSPEYIEEVCGVKALKDKWEAQLDDIEWYSDEEESHQ